MLIHLSLRFCFVDFKPYCDLRHYLRLSHYTTENRDQTPLDSDDAVKHMVYLTFVKVAHYD